MTSDVANRAETAIARPLKILVELIKEDFDDAEKAGMSYYKAAGDKLNEAKEGHFNNKSASEFYDWAQKTFGKKRAQIRVYMALGFDPKHKSFKTLSDFEKRALGREEARVIRRDWGAPVGALADKVLNEQRRLMAEELTRRQERDAEAQLGRRLIDIGYKVLALELHPDKVGGSREAMTRLNRVRDRLKSSV